MCVVTIPSISLKAPGMDWWNGARPIWVNNTDACHDDVIKWKHFPRYWPFVRGIHRSPVNSPHKGQWLGALMFTLICARINGWVNNREAGELKRSLWRHRNAKWFSETNFSATLIKIYHFWPRHLKFALGNGGCYIRSQWIKFIKTEWKLHQTMCEP